MQTIVLATANPHKVTELRAIFDALRVPAEIVSLSDAGGPFEEPSESGSTFEANAAIKALGYARQTGRICLADDSGLEIDGLGGRPGVISSHYSTDGVETGLSREERDRLNIVRVMKELEGADDAARAARFVCVMCLAEPGRLLGTARGTFEGWIGRPPRVPAGDNGFGYDPIFLAAPDHARTSAEMTPEEKDRVSHRARAAEAIGAIIARM